MDSPYWLLLSFMLFLGLGVGVTLPPLSRSVIGMVDPRQMGAVSGVFNMFRNLGGPVGIAVAASIFGNRVAVRAQEAFLHRAGELSVPPSLLQALARGGQPGSESDPSVAGALKALGPMLTQLQVEAKAQGMTGALVDVAWVLLGLCALTLLVTLLLPNLRPLSRDARLRQMRPTVVPSPPREPVAESGAP